MFDLIAAVLSWFYGLVPSYGFAIIMLTLVVMVIVTPLTLKGTRSMIKMQHLQPEMKKIQTRYKGDREAMNKEMMAFYQANNINPMGGCLPLLIQAPVFMVLYAESYPSTRCRERVEGYDPAVVRHWRQRWLGGRSTGWWVRGGSHRGVRRASGLPSGVCGQRFGPLH